MILIISNPYEPSTDNVIDVLLSEKADFLRINSDELASGRFFINIEEDFFWINSQPVDIGKINVIWYRRWYDYHTIKIPGINKISRQLRNHVIGETNQLSYFFFKSLEKKIWLSDPFSNITHNKLDVLKKAAEVGLLIPKTIVCSQKKDLVLFAQNDRIITKPMGDPSLIQTEEAGYKSYTEELTTEFINSLPDSFYPSMFQELIVAKNEIRIFFLENEFYATSLVNSFTTDIKLSVSYGMGKINMVAFNLPSSISKQLSCLMRILKLNSGSIDMIIDENEKFYFLEVNPVGQFGGYAVFNNYYLERKIAYWLIDKDKSNDR